MTFGVAKMPVSSCAVNSSNCPLTLSDTEGLRRSTRGPSENQCLEVKMIPSETPMVFVFNLHGFKGNFLHQLPTTLNVLIRKPPCGEYITHDKKKSFKLWEYLRTPPPPKKKKVVFPNHFSQMFPQKIVNCRTSGWVFVCPTWRGRARSWVQLRPKKDKDRNYQRSGQHFRWSNWTIIFFRWGWNRTIKW